MKKTALYAGATILIWSTLSTVAKLVLTDIPNLQALSVSSVFSFLFLLVINVINGKIKLLRHYRIKDYLIMAGLGFLGLFLYSALYYYGISILSSQEACILNYLWPIMIVVFSCILLREKMTVRKGIALASSFAGVVVISLSNDALFSGGQLFGILACIAAAISYGLFSVLNKKAAYDQSILMMITWFEVVVFGGALGLLTEKWVPIYGLQWAGLLWLGIVVDAIAYLLWAVAINQAKHTAVIANLAYLIPFLSMVLSAVVLKEEITINAVIALVLIIGGILLQSIPFQSRKAK